MAPSSRLSERESNGDRCSLIEARLGLDRTAMRRYDLPRQVESKAQASRRVLPQMRIRLKQQGQLVACDARAVIAYFNDGVRAGLTYGHVDGWRFRGMLDGV